MPRCRQGGPKVAPKDPRMMPRDFKTAAKLPNNASTCPEDGPILVPKGPPNLLQVQEISRNMQTSNWDAVEAPRSFSRLLLKLYGVKDSSDGPDSPRTAKMPPRGAETTPRGPRDPKTTPRDSKMSAGDPKMAKRWPQIGPKITPSAKDHRQHAKVRIGKLSRRHARF